MFEVELSMLLKGDATPIFSTDLKNKVVYATTYLLQKPEEQYDDNDYKLIEEMLHIGNILWNNTDLTEKEMPVDSDLYDYLLVRYKRSGRIPQVGGEPIRFDNLSKVRREGIIESKPLISIMDDKELMFEKEILTPNYEPNITKDLIQFIGFATDKKYRNVTHDNPNLVGTLDKAKFVLNRQAEDKGCFNDPSTQIFERDFFVPHLQKGYISYNIIIRAILELKYDGISVVCRIQNGMVTFAYSRGDTEAGAALDYTPILYGYRFPNLPNDVELEVKFEAIISHYDLARYNAVRGKEYASPRSAITGLFGQNDGYLYRDFITLVPLAVAGYNEELPPMTREEEIIFLNKYVATKEPLRYAVVEGDYNQILFYVKKFAEEAEFARDYMPFLYDGVVFSYDDIELRRKLGRENFINKYSIAIKFNPMKKHTRLIGIEYTIGKNGILTPMCYYEPVIFLGGVHTKSSLSSVNRLNENQFKLGNIVELEYRNDVMPYCTNLPDLDENINNPNPVIQVIDKCPVCGGQLEFSVTGKSARCINLSCPGRGYSRMDDMFKKLRLKDIAGESISKVQKNSLTELINTTEEEAKFALGEANGMKLMRNIQDILTNPRYDFELVGALGFSDVAQTTFEKIFNVYTLEEIIKMFLDMTLRRALLNIKGIGPATADVIENEFSFFMDDIVTIQTKIPYKSSKGLRRTQIRCTGFRDAELMQKLRDEGYDADDNAAVTKDTNILIIKDANHTSTKINKVGPSTLIVTRQEFMENMDEYLDMHPAIPILV